MNRGGKREGAGRPPKPETEHAKPVTVWLTPEQREWVKTNGGTRAIKALIDREIGGQDSS